MKLWYALLATSLLHYMLMSKVLDHLHISSVRLPALSNVVIVYISPSPGFTSELQAVASPVLVSRTS